MSCGRYSHSVVGEVVRRERMKRREQEHDAKRGVLKLYVWHIYLNADCTKKYSEDDYLPETNANI
jgi:hypothetical protein